ncbi:hypothetical protein C1645_818898 [Glomus cerebriforme]|uniref:TLDc domain-containing protein n=1 Tax=Glomus cerebriforme TaxID=658196 RepID=A0A397T6J6_9GLOM|nr:hypothetical protein C1645_818898 [Glomus cerebriforme]
MIIKPKHAIILAKWTQRKETNARISKDEYNFNLTYRGSRDGFNISTMRSKCNGQGACILVIKIKENGTIIGGYNPLGWSYRNNNNGYNNGYGYNYNQYYWGNTTESFIFSLGDGKDLKKFKISRVTSPSNATYDLNYNNINMTLNFGNSDLVINGTNGSCNQSHYESSILDVNNFSIEEMEIFKFY